MATESDYMPEIFEDLGQITHIEGFAPRADEQIEIADSVEAGEAVKVLSIMADAKRLCINGLAVVREHPVWTTGIGGTGAVIGVAAGGLTLRALHSRK